MQIFWVFPKFGYFYLKPGYFCPKLSGSTARYIYRHPFDVEVLLLPYILSANSFDSLSQQRQIDIELSQLAHFCGFSQNQSEKARSFDKKTFIFVLIETVASRLVLKDCHGIQRLAHSKEPCGELSVLLLTYSSRHLIISGIIFRGQTF